MTDEHDQRPRKLAMAGLIVVSLFLTGVGAVAAQSTATPTPGPIEDNATYYDNETGETNTSEWIPGDGNATAPRMLEMIARIPGIFIGVGSEDPSGSGYEGFLLTGLIIGAATLFATVGTNIGPVAGSMIGMVIAYGMTTVGLIPPWIQPLLIFTIVGVPASVAILRVFRR